MSMRSTTYRINRKRLRHFIAAVNGSTVLEVVFNALLDEVNCFNNEIKMKMSPSQKKPAM